MPTYNFSNFPKACVAFGGRYNSTNFEKLQEGLSKLKLLTTTLSQTLHHVAIPAAKVAALVIYPSQIAAVLTVMSMLIGEVDKIYKELKNLEHKFFNSIVHMKLEALNVLQKNLQNTKSSKAQKIAEVVTAVSHLTELHHVFDDETSIFRERYYDGGPLFVHLCGILKAVCLIAEQTNGYDIENLQSVKMKYQKTLDWYKNRCIGRRLASCYTTVMLSVPGLAWTHDWKNHVETYSNYYEEETSFPWITYAKDLGGKGWRLWCGKFTYCKLVDLWDTRPRGEVTFEKFKIHNTSARISGHGVGAAVAVLEPQYHRDVLREYRRRVEKVMLEFFNDANVIC